jgi:sugar lactone lactonase YvrE
VYVADSMNCRVRKYSPVGGISTVAGDGVCGYTGDGGPATAARLNFPQGVALTPSGELLVADADNCRIRRVDLAGTITTFAGTGLCIYGGDGGVPSAAFLAYPHGVATNASGDVFIADTDNCRIRKVTGSTITTFAGTGACGSVGDGGLATSASVSRATAVWPDLVGNVYIADTTTCRIRVVTSGGVISTLAGNGTCGFSGDGGAAYAASINKPRGVATDDAGDVYIADTDNCRIRKVSYPSVIITTIAGTGVCGFTGDGSALATALNRPRGILVQGGELFVADTNSCRLRTVASGLTSTIAGTGGCRFGGDGGTATNASLANPGDVAVDGTGNVYIADTGNCRIRRVGTVGTITTIAGNGACGYSGDGASATAASLNAPRSIAVSAAGDLYIADSSNCRIRRVSAGIISTFAGNGTCAYGGDGGLATSASLSYPQGIAVAGTTVYIADTFNCRVRRVAAGIMTTIAGDGSCTVGGDGGIATNASFTFPYAVDADPTGVYIADTFNCRIRKVAGGTAQTIAGGGPCAFGGDGGPATSALVNHPVGIASQSGAVFVADTNNCRVRLVSATTIVGAAGVGLCGFGGDGGATTSALLHTPGGVAISAAGVYVADTANGRIRLIQPGSDLDGDGSGDILDNCAAIANPDQANNDRNFIDTGPLPQDDVTRPNSDEAGDACDSDDDNDGLTDIEEAIGCNGSGPLNPFSGDTDGDRVLDKAECLLGSNPALASSAPPAIVLPDADMDGVPDQYDPNDAATDSDGDKVSDRVEFRFYNTNLSSPNTDGDTCGDGREVASINGDNTVNVADMGITASRFGNSTTPQYLVQLDTNKDGTINVADMGIIASLFGACP